MRAPERGVAHDAPAPEADVPARRRRQPDVVHTPRSARRWPAVILAGLAAVVGLLACSGAGFWWLDHRLRPAAAPPALAELPPATKPPTVRPRPPQPPITAQADAPKKDAPAPKPGPVETTPAREPSPPPPVETPKELALSEDLPPGLSFQITDAINAHRARAKQEPAFLDVEASRGCQAHAEYLARNAPRVGDNEGERRKEQLGLPGFSEAGLRSAQTAVIVAEEPHAAIEGWFNDPAGRSRMLEPRLRTFAAGFARNAAGQWFSVFDWTRGIDREESLNDAPVRGAIVYPVPGQRRVPLWFPGIEIPDPLPEAKNKLAGYPITLTFPAGTRVDSVKAQLRNADEPDIELWLSSPEKPANPRHADSQRGTISLIAKQPLRPDQRYQVEVSARVQGENWSAKWGFATLGAAELHHEMAGAVLRAVNAYRREAGLPPVPLDEARSKACQSHARYLGRNAPGDPMLDWNAEKPDLPGYSEAGAAVARRASIQGGGGATEAVSGLIHSLIGRPQLLDPRLRSLGLGYVPFAQGGWLWVMDLARESRGAPALRVYLYPAPDQKEVPLFYPANEVPTPIPAQSGRKDAGYAITAEFVAGEKVTAASGKVIASEGRALEGWLSSPEKPAIADFAQRSICFLPSAPLQPDTRYTATFKAEVDGQPWERSWSFTTMKQPDRFADGLGERLLARVNAVRKTAGLEPVRLDVSLSQGCQQHAHYLSLNAKSSAAHGLAVHREDAALPGATPEGARAARASVIAVVLDPRTCVDGWMATLYHRIPLLTPDLERIGFGHARFEERKWACVLDSSSGRKGR